MDSDGTPVPRKSAANTGIQDRLRPTHNGKPRLGSLFLRFGTLVPFVVLGYFVFTMSAQIPQHFMPLSTGLEVEQIDSLPSGHDLATPATNGIINEDLELSSRDSQSLL